MNLCIPMPIYAYTYLLSYLSIYYLSSYLPHTACAAKLAIFETLSIRDYWLLPYDSICNRSGKTWQLFQQQLLRCYSKNYQCYLSDHCACAQSLNHLLLARPERVATALAGQQLPGVCADASPCRPAQPQVP